MTTMEPIESHAVHSQRLLDHAAKMIEQGDRLQASEKIWGAAAHKVKQIAADRNWPNDSHTDGFSIVYYIAREVSNRRISELFGLASDTHQNYYEDRLQLDILDERLEAITEFVALIERAHQSLPPDLPMPDDRHYRNRHA